MNKAPIIRFDQLSKRFSDVLALKDISLEILPGSIVGMVGANGCGKSTLLRHIVGLYLPTTGTCTTFGTPGGELSTRQLGRIGYVHQEGKLVNWMSVEELIHYVASHYPQWNKVLENRFVESFDLDRKAKVGTLSPGKRQQLAILLAIGFEPELLILDEPASGLDPIARKEFLQYLLDIIQDDKRSIIISSHILTDIEKIIDHVVVMQKGEIIRDCAFDALQEEFVKYQIRSLNGALPDTLPFGGLVSMEKDDHQALIVRKNDGLDVELLAGQNGLSAIPLPINFDEIYELVLQSTDKRPGVFK